MGAWVLRRVLGRVLEKGSQKGSEKGACYGFCSKKSGKKKEPKPKLFGPDILQWGRGLPRERVGAKKFDMSLETQGIKLFGRDIPGFRRDIPEVPEKFEKNKFVFNFRSLKRGSEKGSQKGF